MKFCANCGSQMADEDRVCGNCGTFAEGAEPIANGQGEPSPAPVNMGTPAGAPADNSSKSAAETVKKNIFAIIGGVVAFVVVVVAVICIIVANTGYKTVLKSMCKDLKNEDFEGMYELESIIASEYYADYYGSNYYDAYDNMINATLDKFTDKVGDIDDISYEVDREHQLSDRELREVKKNLEKKYNLDTSEIKKIYELDIKLHVKGSKKATYAVDDIYVVKEEGGWKIVYGYRL